MATEMGEYVVGAYLKLFNDCDVVDYNARTPGGGLQGLNELDVVGYNFKGGQVFLCEVTTHTRGLLYGSYEQTVEKIRAKHLTQQRYAQERLDAFEPHFQFWSPNVPSGVAIRLREITTLHSIINREYKECVERLKNRAAAITHDVGNPFFRTLQILESMNDRE